MRVISGSCKGKRLKSVKGLTTRPTADRVKEAVFNVLGFRIADAVFLDLFAGTGNIGIEALSRGAASAIFVEKDRKAVQVIGDNLVSCKLESKGQIYPVDCFKALKIFNEKRMQFNLVFLDPPYKLFVIDELLQIIANTDLLIHKSIVIAETAPETELISQVNNLKKVRENRYGDTKITYYQLDEEGV